jgi:O-antigen ligase
MMIEPVLFYIVMRSIRLDEKSVLRMVDALLLAGFVVSVVGFWLFVQGEATITAEAGARRLASVYGSPNNVGLFLGRCLPFALSFVIVKTDQRRRLFAITVLLVMGLAIVVSQSAGALFIGVPVAVAAVFILAWGRRAWLAILGLGGIAIVAFQVALQSARFARLLDFSSGTNFARIRVWQSALNVIRDHPVTGLGLDQFLYAFQGKYIMPDAWQEPNLSHPHNFVLDFWVRLGLFGVLIFVWIQAAFWRAAYRAYTFYRGRDSLYFALIIGAIGSMINLLSHGLVDNSIYVQDLSLIFVFLLGLVADLSNTGAIDE